jgi:hypothetical protein
MKPILFLLAFLIQAGVCRAANVLIQVSETPPPREIGESIRNVLQPRAVQALEGGKASYQFWFRTDIPLKAKPESIAKDLDAIDETTLLGAATVAEGQRDYRDSEIAPGTYTIRYGLQPQDGDHLGTSEFPYFAVLIPAKSDPDLDGLHKFKSMVKASSKGTASGHPIVLSLRPLTTAPGDAPSLSKPAPDHQAIRLKLNGKPPGSDPAIPIGFDLVFRGKYKS